MHCTLCRTKDTEPFHKDNERDYYRCTECRLIFVDPEDFLSADEEKGRYDLHQNSPEDPEYRRFLNRLFDPLKDRISAGSQGLDFGSGPGPTLSVMFEESGYPMEIYDHFYAMKPEVLERKYDFITATEVLEHLHEPQIELEKLWKCLHPGGHLGIMTKLALDEERFSRWHYKSDPTHVSFFSKSTFEWLAKQWQADLTFEDKDVILLKKQD